MSEATAWFYKTKAWRECQAAYMKSQHYVCERCGRPAKFVHHKVYLNAENVHDPNVTLNWDNLEALCATCHNEEHFAGNVHSPRTRQGLRFDQSGQLVKVVIPPSVIGGRIARNGAALLTKPLPSSFKLGESYKDSTKW